MYKTCVINCYLYLYYIPMKSTRKLSWGSRGKRSSRGKRNSCKIRRARRQHRGGTKPERFFYDKPGRLDYDPTYRAPLSAKQAEDHKKTVDGLKVFRCAEEFEAENPDWLCKVTITKRPLDDPRYS